MQKIYMIYESMGMNKTATDAAILAETGMSVVDFVTSQIEAMDEKDLMDENKFIYYVKDGVIYLGDDWDSEMLECKYSVDGDKMSFELLGKTISLTKDAK